MKKKSFPNILVEKQKFYIGEFEQEEAWLSFMHKEGWKFLSTDGFHYQFAKAEKEDWCYQLDYNNVAEADYIQMYQDFGWEYVGHSHHWFFFRKKCVAGEKTDTSAFSDRESKIAFCKRILNGQLLRLLPIILVLCAYYALVLLTGAYDIGGLLGYLINCFAVAAVASVIFLITNYLSQMNRIRKIMKNLKDTE